MATKKSLESLLDITDYLQMYRALGRRTEEELKTLLELELNGRKRATIIERLHSRMSTKRRAREKKELAERMKEIQA